MKYVLDIARMDRGDPTLAQARDVGAVRGVRRSRRGVPDVADPEALVPNLPAIVDVAKDDAQDARAANDARRADPRGRRRRSCLAPLLGMVGAPHRSSQFKYVAANNALKCGGTKAILDVVRALPDAGAYAKDQVTGEISGQIARMTPRDQVLAAARTLLAERSTVARWIGDRDPHGDEVDRRRVADRGPGDEPRAPGRLLGRTSGGQGGSDPGAACPRSFPPSFAPSDRP